jgi:hypothetical protein
MRGGGGNLTLGEKIGEESGKVIGTRVLSVDPAGPKVEISVQQSGKLLGKETTTSITYWSTPRSGGLIHGEGQGSIMTPDGEMATFTGSGIGKLLGRGNAVSFRGALFYQTGSKGLARLNEVVGMFEFEVDESGNTHGKVWEWK